jgi:hypothetical protein
MERNMAMEWPRSRIISIELKNQMSESRHILRIPPLWVLWPSDGDTIPRPCSVMEDVEIVAM